MLDRIGDILNWAAAALAFPLMFLPLAAFVEGRARGTLAFNLMVAATVGAGYAFAVLAPDLATPLLGDRLLVFAAAIAVVAALVAAVGGPRPATALLSRAFSAVARRVGRVVMWLVLAMALLQFVVVIMRYVFGVSFIVMQEGITYMHGAVFLLAAGYALLTDDHVRVDIFYRGATERRKALFDFWGVLLLLFPTCLLVLWTASGYVGHSWAVKEGSNEQSGLAALYILKSFIPAFAVLVAMAGFSLAARAGDSLRKTGR